MKQMQVSIQHPVYGEILYSESAWTGKKSLTFNGIEAKRIVKNRYDIGGEHVIIKGNYIFGVTLRVDSVDIQLTPKVKFYEILLAFIPLLFILTWGNSPALCAIFPVIGGALGGALGGIGAVASLLLMKRQRTPIAKVIVGIVVAALTILLAYLGAVAFLQLIYSR